MNNILIVAAREFRQIAGMRSFWLTLLILPLALAIGPLSQRFLHNDQPDRIMIIDRTGGATGKAIEQRLAADQDARVLASLSNYVRRHHLENAGPGEPWAEHDRLYGSADAQRFAASGGLAAAQRRIKRVAPDGTPDFDPPKPDYEVVAAPDAVAKAPDSDIGQRIQALIDSKDKDAKHVNVAILIPEGFGKQADVRLWTSGKLEPALVSSIQDVLTRDLRGRFLAAQGVSASNADAALSIAPNFQVTTPPPGGGAREAMLVRSILPLAAAYMLMMSLMLSGSWMLQGTVEERSNKLLETVLACISPEELMYGKLLGTVAVGLFMIAVWITCGAFAAFATHGAIADMIRPALAPLSSPGAIVAMIYFFVMGYITISVLFLAIGAMSDSMRDAQGYLMPVIMVIILPITLLIQAVVSGAGGIAITILTWVPIWTPFAVLARLGAGIPAWEVVGSGLLLALFTGFELIVLGRLFRASLLATGQKPSLKEVIARIRHGGN